MRALLPPAGLHAPLLFAVEPGRHLHASRTQANALGAKGVVRRPLQVEEVRQALAELGIAVAAPMPTGIEAEPGGVSIKAAAKLLDGAFQSLSAGAPLDVGQAVDTSRQLLSGVGQSGLNPWLDTVRGYHDGTFQHCLLVTGTCVAYALQAGMSEGEELTLTVAALLHDIGKAEIPIEILDKPGKLTDEEFEVVKRHPLIAHDYLVGQRSLPPGVLSAITHHHEFLDGSGYPHQLRGDEIEPLTRMLTVCDIYGALAERRAYKTAKTPHDSILILADMARRGKVDYEIVRTLGFAVGVPLPERQFHIA